MGKDIIELDSILLHKVLNQLIISDGMEVTNDYLLQQKIYYVDNVALIEELEKLLMKHYFEQIFEEKGNVNPDELFSKYTPQYINYDKHYRELEQEQYHKSEHMEEKKSEQVDNTLNKYFQG